MNEKQSAKLQNFDASGQPSAWDGDLLGRQDDAEFLLRFIVSRVDERKRAGRRGSYVLNVDAEWGHGKTFFMRGLFEDIQKAEHPAVFIDAWKNDFGDDPYTHVISEIESYFKGFVEDDPKTGPQAKFKNVYKAVKSNAGKIFWTALKGGAKRATRYVIGESTDEIIEVVQTYTPEGGREIASGSFEEIEKSVTAVNDSIIDAFADKRMQEFEEAKQSLANFKTSLAELLRAFEEHTGKKLPLFLLIDELDRCRPTYAITMLERIKHLFDVDDVVFILSTDTQQISHAIRAIYGAGFESKRYLQRFFSRTYQLPKPSVDELVETLVADSGVDPDKWSSPGITPDHVSFLAKASYHFDMSLRDVKQSVDILLSLTTTWREKGKIELSLMYPLIFGFLSGQDIDNLGENGWLWRRAAQIDDWIENDVGSFDGFKRFNQFNKRGDVVLEFLRKLRQPLYETMRVQVSEGSAIPTYTVAYVDDQLKREYHLRFSNVVRETERGDMLKYPALIKHAGNLRIY
ncbi:hypothetical protein IB276_17950 [Ensifer sp. ENS04]|uniref:KAP family P-loop NTPase fold protein n=1 Tax=Ensifer sp. ENS04 TaxID=2769281 RepID=UPI001782FBB6|nr:P-loop NTPase fold protein [Ensifer sp. ENS04]MBD9541341.1 hypothetical protein [Ensifer sp. ENS04]